MSRLAPQHAKFGQFHDQFVLCQDAACLPAGWERRSCSGWFLATHPHLPVLDLRMAGGRHVGWLCGYVVAPDGSLVDGEIRLPEHIQGDPRAERVEQELYQYGGRYACALVTGQSGRLYLDPFGSLATVFGTTHRIAASTVSLVQMHLPGGPDARPLTDDFPHGRPGPNQSYPAGLTGDPDVRRLLPNHYLDLGEWRAVRHWPGGQIERIAECRASDQIDILASEVRNNLQAVTDAHEAYLTLTAGRDSRMLLACFTPEMIDRITCVTFDYQNGMGWNTVDVLKAGQLARRCGAPHQVLPVGPVTEMVKQDYLFRTGRAGSFGKSQDFFQACVRHLDLSRAWMTSFGGEITTYPFMRRLLDTHDPRTSTNLLARLKVPQTKRFHDAMHQWIVQLPEIDVHLLNDLLWLENALACLSTPQFYGTAPFRLNLVPFCHRRVVEACYRLPVAYRQRLQVSQEITRRASWDLQSMSFGMGRYR